MSLSLSGILQGIGNNLISNSSNLLNNAFNVSQQRSANRYNVEAQKQMNAQNLAWQTQENNITRAREDNAVQRAAADMQAAGLSKTLAAGSPASASSLTAFQGQAPSVNAVQSNYQYSPLEVLEMVGKAKEIENNDKITASNLVLNDSQAKLNFSNMTKLDTENDYLAQSLTLDNALKNQLFTLRNLEAEQKRLQIEVDKGSKDAKIELAKVNVEIAKLERDIKNYDFGLAQQSLMPTGYLSSTFGGAGATLLSNANNVWQWIKGR